MNLAYNQALQTFRLFAVRNSTSILAYNFSERASGYLLHLHRQRPNSSKMLSLINRLRSCSRLNGSGVFLVRMLRGLSVRPSLITLMGQRFVLSRAILYGLSQEQIPLRTGRLSPNLALRRHRRVRFRRRPSLRMGRSLKIYSALWRHTKFGSHLLLKSVSPHIRTTAAGGSRRLPSGLSLQRHSIRD
jgi:hypothetical protein